MTRQPLSIPGDVYHGALDLVVIDEAHHLHSDGMLELIIKHYVKMESTTKLILLSDASQSGAIEMANKFDTQDIRLEFVVRSTQTIVQMGAQFAKGDVGVLADHSAQGPPGCSFLFDLANDATGDQIFEEYADNIAKATKFLIP